MSTESKPTIQRTWRKFTIDRTREAGYASQLSGGGQVMLTPAGASDGRMAYTLVIQGVSEAVIRARTFETIKQEAEKIIRRHEKKTETEEGFKA